MRSIRISRSAVDLISGLLLFAAIYCFDSSNEKSYFRSSGNVTTQGGGEPGGPGGPQ